MRIAVIAPPWLPVPPPAYGGTETVLDLLCRGLAGAGHETVLFTTGESACPVARAWVYDEAQTPRIGDTATELRHVLHAYDGAGAFDVIHDHTLAGPVLAAARGDLAVVTTNHGPFDAQLSPIYRRVADTVPVIAISAAQAASAGDVPIAAVIHHAVEPHRFAVGTGSGDYVLFLGRMAPSKGAHLAARAAREAGVRLLLAAKMREPAEHEYFDAAVRPLLGDGVEYVGEVGADEKVALLGAARALLNPIQWQEPFGMVMIEALACATPVIALARGAAPEIVDHGVTGFLCDGPRELAGALGAVDALDRQACRRAVEERFAPPRFLRQHLEVYQRSIDEARTRRRLTSAA
jgi:glycosyltransferase involved in cell wall biosynthesis